MNDPLAPIVWPVAVIVVDDEMPLSLIDPLVVEMFPLVVDIFPIAVIVSFLSCCYLLIPQTAEPKYLRQFALQ